MKNQEMEDEFQVNFKKSRDMKTKLGLNAKYKIHIFNGIYFLPHYCFKGLMGKLMTAKIASCAKGCVTGVPCIE